MNTMKRAWEIAKEAVVKFGGKAKEYLAGALKMAWAEVKSAGEAALVKYLPARGKTWAARITDLCPTYKFKREFLEQDSIDEDGEKVFNLTAGVYEFFDGKKRFFMQIDPTATQSWVQYEHLTAAEVKEIIA